jgi:hypothetical protein
MARRSTCTSSVVTPPEELMERLPKSYLLTALNRPFKIPTRPDYLHVTTTVQQYQLDVTSAKSPKQIPRCMMCWCASYGASPMIRYASPTMINPAIAHAHPADISLYSCEILDDTLATRQALAQLEPHTPTPHTIPGVVIHEAWLVGSQVGIRITLQLHLTRKSTPYLYEIGQC